MFILVAEQQYATHCNLIQLISYLSVRSHEAYCSVVLLFVCSICLSVTPVLLCAERLLVELDIILLFLTSESLI